MGEHDWLGLLSGLGASAIGWLVVIVRSQERIATLRRDLGEETAARQKETIELAKDIKALTEKVHALELVDAKGGERGSFTNEVINEMKGDIKSLMGAVAEVKRIAKSNSTPPPPRPAGRGAVEGTAYQRISQNPKRST